LTNPDALSRRSELFANLPVQHSAFLCHVASMRHTIKTMFLLSFNRSETRTACSAVSRAASLSSLARTSSRMQEPHRLLSLHARSSIPCSTTTASHFRTLMQDRHAFAPSPFNEPVHLSETRTTHIHVHLPRRFTTALLLSKDTMVSKQAVFPERARKNDALYGCYLIYEQQAASR
jgi:hypothetical protein